MLPERPNGHSRAGVAPYPCWIEVNLDAITANVRALKQLVGSSTAIAAVVKADGYGLGATRIARVALAAGAEWLAVARVEEGAELRRGGVTAPILNLAYMPPDEIETAVRFGITPTVVDATTAAALASFVPAGASLSIHVKVDTGLSRFGAQPNELDALLACLNGLGTLQLDGLYSHFATADETDLTFARQQIQRFMAAETTLEAQGFRPRWRHLANSAATLALPEARRDLVRLGITLSGHYPSAEMSRTVDLRPAVSLKARVARVYDLPAGTSVGYGQTYFADRAIRAAVVPVGYADGLPRSHSNQGEVLVQGRRVPLIGRVSMDQCVADVSIVPEAQPGDEVVLIGEQGRGRIDLWEFAAWGDTIAHEALCRLGPRVPRCYVADGAIREIAWIGHRGDSPGGGEQSFSEAISAPGRLAGSRHPRSAAALPATSLEHRPL